MKCFCKLLLAIVFMLCANLLYACTCFPIPLIQQAELGGIEHLVRLRVEAYEQTGNNFPRFMEGSIVDEIRGEIGEDRIQVYGGDGLSCAPYVTDFEVGTEWLIPLTSVSGLFYLPGCMSKVRLDGDDLIGLISPLVCTSNPASENTCSSLTSEEFEQALSSRTTLDEFNTQLALYAEAVSWTLQACSGPWSRCTGVRANYNPESGELILPAIDVVSSPANFGVSARMQLMEGAEDTFRVIEVE